MALGNDLDAVVSYIENVIKHRKPTEKKSKNEQNTKQKIDKFDKNNLDIFINPITKDYTTIDPNQSVSVLSGGLFSKNDNSRKRITPVIHIDDTPTEKKSASDIALNIEESRDK